MVAAAPHERNAARDAAQGAISRLPLIDMDGAGG
jgi:hypothetical protein